MYLSTSAKIVQKKGEDCTMSEVSKRVVCLTASTLIKWFFVCFGLAFVILFGYAASASAETYTVDSPDDSVDSDVSDNVCKDSQGRCTLRAAIMQSNGNKVADTIIIPPGTYTLSLAGVDEDNANKGDLDITDPNLTIIGAGNNPKGDPALTVIDAGNLDRAFDINPNHTGDYHVTLQALTIKNGRSVDNGLYNRSGGGGISANIGNGFLTISNCILTNNSAPGTAGLGGGLSLYGYSGGSIVIEDSVIKNNLSYRSGGGVFLQTNSNVQMKNTTIESNISSTDSGGGVYFEIFDDMVSFQGLTIENSTINHNTSTGNGGGIYIKNKATLKNVTIYRNRADATFGGGIFILNPVGNPVTMTNLTITENSGWNLNGSGIAAYVADDQLFLHNSIVWANSGSDFNDATKLHSTSSNNLLATNSNGGVTNGVNGNILGMDPKLGLFADNGGPTQTFALLNGSPAIDAGDNSKALAAGLITDQRGTERIVDSADSNTDATVDIGAYEAQATLPDISNTTTPANTAKSVNVNVGNSTMIGSVTALSSNQSVIPNGNIVVSGTGAERTITFTPASGQTGAATITVSVADTIGGPNATDTFEVTVLPPPNLSISLSHSGEFVQGKTGASYTIGVTNQGEGSTSGVVSVVDSLPAGLTATEMSGVGWTCDVATLTCTRSDELVSGASYPDITVTVKVEHNAVASVTNTATVSTIGDSDLSNNSANDPTTVVQLPSIQTVMALTDGVYRAGQKVDLKINYSKNVTVTTTGGKPYLPIYVGPSLVNAYYESGSGTSSLVFSYTVQPGDNDSDGITVQTNLVLNGGSIADSLLGHEALTLLMGPADTSGIKIDTVDPQITTVNIPANGTYQAGQHLDFTVNFNESVLVDTTSGTPTMDVKVGTETVTANYLSGSGSSALVFRYTIQPGNNDTDGIELGTSIALNSGTVRDTAGNSAILKLNGVNSTENIKIDANTPEVHSVTLPVNGYYRQGDKLNIAVKFSEKVLVTGGIPYIPLTIGAMTKQASYVSGSSTDTLTFQYTVQPADNDTDGMEVGNAIVPNGSTIKDLVDNAGNLTLTPGDTTGILIDNTSPSVPTIDLVDGTWINNSEYIFSGQAETNTTINLLIDSVSKGTVAVGGDGKWSLTTNGLTEGPHRIKVISTDAAGNTSESTSVNFSVDHTVPAKPGITVSETNWTKQDVTFELTGEVGSKLQYKIDGGSWVDYSGIVTMTDEGEFNLLARQMDDAQNVSDTETATIRIDKTAPVITLKGQASMSIYRGSTYQDPGVTITDNLATELTPVITHNVDTNTLGTYIVRYNTQDLATNPATEVTRTVKVVMAPLPPPPPPLTPVTGVQLAEKDVTMQVNGEPVTLHATVLPGDATNKQVRWSSSNPEVAEVDSNGTVQPRKAGTTTITVTTVDGNKTATCLVTVVEEDKKFELDVVEASYWLKPMATAQFKVYAIEGKKKKDITKNKNTSYSVNNKLIEVVPGKITVGKKVGESVITVSYLGETVTIPVTISRVTVQSLTASTKQTQIELDEEQQLTVTATFSNKTKKDVTDEAEWSSSNEEVVEVTDGKIIARNSGTAVITAAYGGKKVKIQVKVVEKALKQVKANRNSVRLKENKTAAITVTAIYDDGTKKEITSKADWQSQNSKIAIVENGVITALAAGRTKITASYGGKTVTINVTVYK